MTGFEIQILVIGMGLGVCFDRLRVLIPQYRKQIRRRKQNADNALGNQLVPDRFCGRGVHGMDDKPDNPAALRTGGKP